MEEDERYLRAKKRVEDLKVFYIHLTVYILINVMLFIINLTMYEGQWWFLYPLGGWGIGLFVHALSVFTTWFLGGAWEERKIKEFMEKDRDRD